VESVAFSPDASRIVSGSLDNTVRMWDVASGACLETRHTKSDVAVLAAGPVAFPWLAEDGKATTVIYSASSRLPVAWFAASLHRLTTSPAGRSWAGVIGNDICIITLEGTPPP
jgi:WD40 repeat protein